MEGVNNAHENTGVKNQLNSTFTFFVVQHTILSCQWIQAN